MEKIDFKKPYGYLCIVPVQSDKEKPYQFVTDDVSKVMNDYPQLIVQHIDFK